MSDSQESDRKKIAKMTSLLNLSIVFNVSDISITDYKCLMKRDFFLCNQNWQVIDFLFKIGLQFRNTN